MNKIFIFFLFVIYLALPGYAATLEVSNSANFSLQTMVVSSEPATTSGYVLFIIPQFNFVDNEYTIPKVVISRAGYTVETASTSTKELALGEDIIKVRPNLMISQIDVKKYKAVILVGGYLSKKFFEDPVLIAKTKEFNDRGALIGAMDNVPYFLAQWGIVGNARITVNIALAKAVRSMGIDYSNKDIVVSRNLVTVDSYLYSDAFAGEFLSELSKRK